MVTQLQRRIDQHRSLLSTQIAKQLSSTAAVCSAVWEDLDKLDAVLLASIDHIEGCKLVFAVDCEGRQISSNISGDIDPAARGQDLSQRPYMEHGDKETAFTLSRVYISRVDRRPCLTALHHVYDINNEPCGCIAADFDLRDLPRQELLQEYSDLDWRQIRGDPAIRQNLFDQERVTSPMDSRISEVHVIIIELLMHRGIFHAKLHYSSSRATLWLYDDPHRYRLHVLDEIIDPEVCLAYPGRNYPETAVISEDQARQSLERFENLRNADASIYLRSGSINIINGMIGLNFSCDGSHYLQVGNFLEKEDNFWFG